MPSACTPHIYYLMVSVRVWLKVKGYPPHRTRVTSAFSFIKHNIHTVLLPTILLVMHKVWECDRPFTDWPKEGYYGIISSSPCFTPVGFAIFCYFSKLLFHVRERSPSDASFLPHSIAKDETYLLISTLWFRECITLSCIFWYKCFSVFH